MAHKVDAPGRPLAGSRLTLLVNPASGGGRGSQLAARLSAMFAGSGVDVTVQFSTSMPDAMARAKTIARTCGPNDSLVVVGGDGMASVGLNACAGTSARLGIIPAGTGNDFCRGLGLPSRPVDACRAIIGGRVGRVDLLSASMPSGEQRYVGSVISTGFDALVNRATNQGPQLGALSYAAVAMRQMRCFTPLRYRLDIDGVPRELDAILVAVGNAGYIGGGVRILPDYSVVDGLLDVTIVHPVPASVLLRLAPKLWTGRRIDHPAIETIRAKRVIIDGDNLADGGSPLFAMADGESLGDVPVIATVAPGVCQVHLP